MKKRTKVLIAVFAILAIILAALLGFLYYRTTPHYQLRHENYTDITLNDGTTMRFIRRFKRDQNGDEIFGVFGDELDLKEIHYIGSDTLTIPSHIGGFPVTGIGTYAAYPISMPGGAFPSDVDLERIKHLTLPDTVTEIFSLNVGPFANLETLHIGKSTADIPWIVTDLKEITVDPDNPRYKLESGNLVDKNTGLVVSDTIEE